MNVDGMYQVLAMQNFVDGNGVSTSHVLPSNLSVVVYEPLIRWPPGYSLLLSPFYVLLNHNSIAAGLTFEILVSIILIITCRGILKLFDTPLYLINLFTLLTGFFIYSFYFICSSDAATVTSFLVAFYFTLLILKKESFTLKLIIPQSICLFLCGLLKYLFIPVVFIIPVFLFLKGFADKKKYLKNTAIISFAFVFIALATMLVWQKITTGSATYISQPTRGFFPDNLNQIYPAIPASFIDPYSLSLVLDPGGLIITGIYRIMQFLHLSILFVFLYYLIKRLWTAGFKNIPIINSFFYTSFFMSAGITLVLVALSLTVGKEENNPGRWWTYVQEPRYYGLINVITHLAVFLLYQYYRINKPKRLKYIFIGLIFLIFPEFLKGVYFTVKRAINVETEEYIWQKEKNIQQYAGMVLQKERLPGEAAAVTGSSYYINYRAAIHSHVPVMEDTESIIDSAKLNAAKPTVLLVIVEEKHLPEYEPFLAKTKNELVGYFRGLYFYTIHVKPH